jgi:hypothetical protein
LADFGIQGFNNGRIADLWLSATVANPSGGLRASIIQCKRVQDHIRGY